MSKIIPTFFSALSKYANQANRSNRYTYIPLNENAWEIRLLTLLPDNFSAKIRINLDIKTLDPSSNNQPCYEALSYTWGSSKNPGEVFVKDPEGVEKQKVISITQNLAVALRHLRDEHEPRRFWIDAICVDQQNLSERSAQVQRMGDIFSRADRVVAWLGAEENDSSLAISLLLHLSSKIDVDRSTNAISPSAEGAAEPHWANRAEKLPYDERESTAIYNLLSRPWFERIWIQQEIRLANSSKAIIKCGFRQMLWSSFWSAILCLHVKPSLSTSAMGNPLDFNERIILIIDLKDEIVATSFFLLLHSTRNCKCSDPRDRIYALLSISPYFKNKLVPDYNKPPQTVYQELVLCYLKIFYDSSILISCEMHNDLPFKQSWISDFSHWNSAILGHFNARRELEGLPLAPSWVPSWSNGDLPEPFRFSWTSGRSPAEVEFIQPSILKVTGVLVAVVKDTQEISFPAQDMPDCLFETITQLYQHATLNLKAESFDTAEQFYDTFCRTLAGNGFADMFHPPVNALPHLQESKNALLKILCLPESPSRVLTQPERDYFAIVLTFASLRSFFSTETGKIGLAPRSAKAGDQVVVLLGCSSPILLRPITQGQFQVVGEAFYYEACFLQSLLGQLPEEYEPRSTIHYHTETGESMGYVPSIINRRTGKPLDEDPRLGPLPHGWRKITIDGDRYTGFIRDSELSHNDSMIGYEEIQGDPRLTSQALAKRGINVKHFELV